LDLLGKSGIGLSFVKLCSSFDLYIDIGFAILSFDGKPPAFIDLFMF